MEPLRQAIISEVIKKTPELEKFTVDQLNQDFFLPSSHRLTYYGLQCVKNVFTPYSFDIGADLHLKSKHYIALSNTMTYPYYLSQNKLILFSEMDAMVIKLCGNVKIFLDRSS